MFGFGKKNEDVVFKPIDRYGIKIQQLNERIDDLQEAVYLLNNPKEKEKRRIEKLVKYVNKGHDGLLCFFDDETIADFKKEIAEYYSRKEK